jgi:hypothetical protein
VSQEHLLDVLQPHFNNMDIEQPNSISGSGPGTVTNVTSPNGTITVATSTTTPAIDIDLTHTNVWTGSQTFTDNAFTIQDDVDNTKKAMFTIGGISTGTTNMYGLPNTTGTLVTIANISQTFVGVTIFTNASLSLGTSTAASTYNLGTGATLTATTKAINIGTAGVSGSTTNINIGSAVAGALGTTTISSPTTAVTGNINLQGTLAAGLSSSAVLAIGTVGSSNLVTYSSNVGASSASSMYQFAGSTNANFRSAFAGSSSSIAISVGNNYANTIVGSSVATTAASGTHTWLANLVANSLGTITSGGATVTNTASLYVGPANTAGTNNYSLYIDTGNTTIGNGNLSLATAGNKLNIATGSNASIGTATLSGGTITVATTAVTASSKIFLTDATTGALTNIGTPTVGIIVAGTSFVINSSNVLDTSSVNWLIIN